MKPMGWFQVALSAEISAGEVQRRYIAPSGLATAEAEGLRALHGWAPFFYPEGTGSGAAEAAAGIESGFDVAADDPFALNRGAR